MLPSPFDVFMSWLLSSLSAKQGEFAFHSHTTVRAVRHTAVQLDVMA